MGFLSKVFKGIKKVVKGVAKGVKKLGKAIWKGVKKVGKAFTKLGPLAMLGAAMIPGVGAFFSNMWKTFGSTMQGWMSSPANPFQKVLGTLGKGVYDGVNWVRGASGSMTDTIKDGFKQIGKGNFSEGMSTFGDTFSSAAKGGKLGISQGDQAIRIASEMSPTTKTVTSFTDAVQAGSPEVGNIADATQRFTQPTQFTASPIADDATRQLASTGTVDGFSASPIPDATARVETVAERAGVTGKEGSSLLDKALKAGNALFDAQATGEFGTYIPGYIPDAPENQITGQIGSIGGGSAGGNFLSQHQLEGYNNYWNRSLGIGQRVGGTV